MSDIVIEVDHLSKRYRLGQIGSHSFREDLHRWWARVRRRDDPSQKLAAHNDKPLSEMWALRDVSFSVKEGEIVGIIGRNGAGKSTLLKIVSRITIPTSGAVRIRGRVGSLLEVGTGFHPELTGRENIFLNGAILGLKRRDITRRLEEIIDFADIGPFVDTPVKRYSSGMHVRLAFAIAAHLEPEILIIDEVLAVGDAAFQRKCLGKMGDVARGGRTVLFVSHNMAAVNNLCARGVLLHEGRVALIGTQTEAVSEYLRLLGGGKIPLDSRADRIGSGPVRVTSIEYRDSDGHSLTTASSGQEVFIHFHFENESTAPLDRVKVSVMAATQMDVPVFLQHNNLTGQPLGVLPRAGVFILRIPRLPLPASVYRLTYTLMRDEEYLDGLHDAAELTVVDGDFFGSGDTAPISHGVCLVDGSWSLAALDEGTGWNARSAVI